MRKTYIACMSNAPQFAYSHIALQLSPNKKARKALICGLFKMVEVRGVEPLSWQFSLILCYMLSFMFGILPAST